MSTSNYNRTIKEIIRESFDPAEMGKLLKNHRANLEHPKKSSLWDQFTGTHSSEKIPGHRSHTGIKAILKNIDLDEWISGILSSITVKDINAALQTSRGKLKKELSQDNLTAKQKTSTLEAIKETKIKISSDLGSMIRKYYMKTKSGPSKDLYNKFMKRSQKKPVITTTYPLDLFFCDVINDKPIGDYNPFNGKESIHTLHTPLESGLMMAYKGHNARHKHSRVLIRRFRKFDRSRHKTTAVKTDIWHMAIIDIIGPIRQQKHILEELVKLFKRNNVELYIPDELRHRFRCDFDFEEKPEKLISGILDPNYAFGGTSYEMPSYQTTFVRSKATKTLGKVYCLIKKAWKIT